MDNNTILNWDDVDYKAIYTHQVKQNPVYWNADLNLWVTYSYAYCKAILSCNDAHVPELKADNTSALNNKAKLMIKGFTRITNNGRHDDARQAAMAIWHSMKTVDTSQLLDNLLSLEKNTVEFDWVTIVAKKLPVIIILKSLGFNDDECAYVTEHISTLVKIMSPNKTAEDIAVLNSIVNQFYTIAENYINSHRFPHQLINNNHLINEETVDLFTCNLVGLFIQCYDAGRALLCNTLLSLADSANNISLSLNNNAYFKQMVVETLRFNPPVHNTRRVAVNDILIGDKIIKAGQSILIVMGAANLDPSIFTHPELFNVSRFNNDQNLTFGLGGHNCFAKYLNIDMATAVCTHLTNKYRHISILQKEFKYEPQLNVRMVKQLMVRLS